jgi:thioredoxin reductase (NADPH)
VLVRGDGLSATMSRYLIERIAAAPNIEVLPRRELVSVEADVAGSLAAASWQHRDTGERTRCELRNLFLFVGAAPETTCLEGCDVELDRAGFIVTGRGRGGRLESSVPGVFAVGDVRSESVKRVGSAIGEGAAVVAELHKHLEAATA